ncbi:hypothetical protein [Pseudonocardia cypriaca]|uniref:Uncharacterized protein n=1 Tax=Pseudonocardia cypriaca TaxID=882449 RepID=A0A543GHS1_9PSEU|nr:hypothetical protein [Pseudonocardia cypriaca]TQM45628.1 hypothetical protein FB388_3028 [Pseudonocardia cypriaca]
MTIDPRLDVVVWAAVLALFLLLGARAWAVETASAGEHRKSVRVRALNGASAVALGVLVVLMAVQGGVALAYAIATRTNPETIVTVVGDPDNTADPAGDAADPAVPDPALPDPNAPAGGTPGAPDPNPGGAPPAPAGRPGG